MKEYLFLFFILMFCLIGFILEIGKYLADAYRRNSLTVTID